MPWAITHPVHPDKIKIIEMLTPQEGWHTQKGAIKG